MTAWDWQEYYCGASSRRPRHNPVNKRGNERLPGTTMGGLLTEEARRVTTTNTMGSLLYDAA